MFVEHDCIAWGTYCDCGAENEILQNKFHPWDDTDFKIRIKCRGCGKVIEVDREQANKYYTERVYRYYDNLSGDIIDLGCGGGFLSQYLSQEETVGKIYAIDKDEACEDSIEEIKDPLNKLTFYAMDISDLKKRFKENSVDYIVNRDVFMFIEEPLKYLDDITAIVRKGIRQMGWYVTGNQRMKNQLKPEEIKSELEKRGWKVEIEYLDWYKSGYFIKADR